MHLTVGSVKNLPLPHARLGSRILAILPEVLRTGTRYNKWRLESLQCLRDFSRHCISLGDTERLFISV